MFSRSHVARMGVPVALALSLLTLVGCKRTDDEGMYSGSGASRTHQTFEITYNGRTKPLQSGVRQAASVTAKGHHVVATTSSSTSSGLVQETVAIHSGTTRGLHVGTYPLQAEPLSDGSTAAAATLRIEGDAGLGLPALLEARSGQLKVEAIKEKDGVLEHLHYSYSGTFHAVNDADHQETYYLTGKVNVRHP